MAESNFYYFFQGDRVPEPRFPRNYLNTSFFHVMSKGINKEFIFNNAVDIKFYIKNMYEIKDKYHNISFRIISDIIHINGKKLRTEYYRR